jgi:hypothetical protein
VFYNKEKTFKRYRYLDAKIVDNLFEMSVEDPVITYLGFTLFLLF